MIKTDPRICRYAASAQTNVGVLAHATAHSTLHLERAASPVPIFARRPTQVLEQCQLPCERLTLRVFIPREALASHFSTRNEGFA